MSAFATALRLSATASRSRPSLFAGERGAAVRLLRRSLLLRTRTCVDACRRAAWCLSIIALAGCAGKTPQGYGVLPVQSTAAQAQQQFEAAQQTIQPDAQQTYMDLIAQMQQAGQWYASLAHVDAFEQQHGTSAESRLLRADALRNTGQSDAARQTYASLLAGPSAARAHRGLGLLHAAEGDYAGAVRQLEQARLRNPIDANILSDIAYAHLLDGRPADARIPALQAAQLAPDNPRVQLNLALYWLATEQHAQAQALLQRLGRPAQGNAAPLIEAQSMQGLQRQLASVRQAIAARQAALLPTPSLVDRASGDAPPLAAPSLVPVTAIQTSAVALPEGRATASP